MNRAPAAMLVAKAFPPSAAVGVHRTLGLCRRLAGRGWRVTVITARPSANATVDRALLEAVPPEVHVVRTPAPDLPLLAARVLKRRAASKASSGKSGPAASPGQLMPRDKPARPRGIRLIVDWLSWWLHVPDSFTGWLLPALWAGITQGAKRRPDVIFSSAPMWTGHVAAAALSRIMNVPLVADFRDPWCGSAFRNIPYAAHRNLNSALEGMVVRRATRITCAWDGIRRHLAARYPKREPDIRTILNGFDPGRIDAIQPVRIDKDRCVFLHAGSFYGPRSPVPLLAGLQHLHRAFPDEAGRLLVVLLGPSSYNGRAIEDIVREYGVQDSVRVLRRVLHDRALALLKGADVAILFGQSGSESLASVPAKVYEYIGTGKPVLAIGAGKEACEVMRNGGCRVWRVSCGDPQEIAIALANILGEYRRNGPATSETANDRCRFTRARMAESLEHVLREAIGSARAR